MSIACRDVDDFQAAARSQSPFVERCFTEAFSEEIHSKIQVIKTSTQDFRHCENHRTRLLLSCRKLSQSCNKFHEKPEKDG
jgi:hypothetical protein